MLNEGGGLTDRNWVGVKGDDCGWLGEWYANPSGLVKMVFCDSLISLFANDKAGEMEGEDCGLGDYRKENPPVSTQCKPTRVEAKWWSDMTYQKPPRIRNTDLPPLGSTLALQTLMYSSFALRQPNNSNGVLPFSHHDFAE